MSETEYVIVGDTEKNNGCLVLVCGKSLETANKALNRMITNPTDSDKALMKEHKNLRIEEVPKEDCWWNENCD